MRTKLPIGLQLYTLGDGLKSDLVAMLGQVAAAGYQTVELAGYLGRTPTELRAALDKSGLKCTSTHVPAKAGPGDRSLSTDLDLVIADAKVIGFQHVVLPMFQIPTRVALKPGEDRRAYLGRLSVEMTVEDWKAAVKLLNTTGARLKAAGLTLGYHNHNVEFAPLAGTTGMEILLKETDPTLVHFEMDAGWVVAAGQDPVALLKAHPGRFRQMHVKDVKATTRPNFAFQQDPTEVGSGIIDWKRLLPAAYAAGIRDFYVEQEAPFERPRIDAARISAAYLSRLVA